MRRPGVGLIFDRPGAYDTPPLSLLTASSAGRKGLSLGLALLVRHLQGGEIQRPVRPSENPQVAGIRSASRVEEPLVHLWTRTGTRASSAASRSLAVARSGVVRPTRRSTTRKGCGPREHEPSAQVSATRLATLPAAQRLITAPPTSQRRPERRRRYLVFQLPFQLFAERPSFHW